jgi:hypothetical protein
MFAGGSLWSDTGMLFELKSWKIEVSPFVRLQLPEGPANVRSSVSSATV